MPDQDPTPSDKEEKDAAAIRIFPPGIPILCILAAAVLQRIWPLGVDTMLTPVLRYGVGGSIILISLYFLGFRAVAMMRKSGQSENPYKKTTEILEAGPYRFTRNPMYLQMVLICVGFAFFLPNIWLLILTPVCVVLLHVLVILPEETYLERKFGATYIDYKKRVRRWI